MYKKIIYSGQESLNKFILSEFPHEIEQAAIFEKQCAKIAAIIYPTSSNSSSVEIKGNNLNLFNIDSLFAKQFKLKTMNEWDYQLFDEKLGNKVDYGVMVGKPLSGKSTLAKVFKDDMDYSVIDMKVLADICKKKLGTDDEPFEGEVGIDKIE